MYTWTHTVFWFVEGVWKLYDFNIKTALSFVHDFRFRVSWNKSDSKTFSSKATSSSNL